MNRLMTGAVTAAAATALVLGAGAPAMAGTPDHHDHHGAKLVLQEQIDVKQGFGRFTAKWPLCRSGVHKDWITSSKKVDWKHDVYRLSVSSRYICDDHSGSFNAEKILWVKKTHHHGDKVFSGPVRFEGGTWRYKHLKAYGFERGSVDAHGHGQGLVLGKIVRL